MKTCEVRTSTGDPLFGLMVHEGQVEFATGGFKYLMGKTEEYVKRWCNQHGYEYVVVEVDDE